MGSIPNDGRGRVGMAAWLTTVVIIACMLAGHSALAASITNVASGLWTNEATWSGGSVPTLWDDVVISNGTTVTIDDMVTHAVSNLTVDGTLTHAANNATPQYKIVLAAGGDVTVTTNGAIDVTAKGYATEQGPGGSTRGGAHGGAGGGNADAPYGSETAPVTLGSGGYEGAGGGAIKVSATGTVTVAGTISADGETAPRPGGAGSVWIVADALAGTGTVSARGGTAVGSWPAGGGGGRIRIDVQTPGTLHLAVDVLTHGGESSGHGDGDSGSVTFNAGTSNLVVAGTLHFATPATNTFHTLIITNGGILEFAANTRTGYNEDTGLYEGRGIVIDAASVNVQTGGVMSGVGFGFSTTLGPGGSIYGGTHGGPGGDSSAKPYGSDSAPFAVGSGGYEGDGGSALKINASGQVTVDGTISADGVDVNRGGAGGSIWIVANTVVGTGLVSARGGTATANRPGGGGGRIRIEPQAPGTLDLTFDVLTNGGEGSGQFDDGDAGSVTFPDGTDVTVSRTLHLGGGTTNTLGTLTIPNGGRLEFGAHTRAGYNAGTGLYEGKGIVINATSIDVQAGGVMTGTGLGFAKTYGPGGSIRGGTHGGNGGTNPDPVYGSTNGPTSLGSGGYDSDSGGAVKLDVSGTLTVDGTISADGVPYGNGRTGSGGSIWIIARTLTGAGAISANGGSVGGGNPWAGAGGGGRIAIEYGSSTFTDLPALGTYVNQEVSSSVTVHGGFNIGADGVEDGSIYVEEVVDERGTVILFR